MTTSSEPLGIVELAGVCDRLADRNHELFEVLGRWVADEPDPARQRWFATAAHRHAWHAELCRERRPSIPVDAVTTDPVFDGGVPERAAWYDERVRELDVVLTAIEARVDPLLDPSTARTVALVRSDLDELGHR